MAVGLLRETRRSGGKGATRHLVRRWLRYSDYLAAERLLRSLPMVRLSELADMSAQPPVPVEVVFSDRDGWSLGPVERMALTAIISGREVTSVLELGTFDGGTTRVLAEAIGEGGRVVTVDLPEERLAAMRLPAGYTPSDVGREYRSSEVASRVTQLRCDSSTLTAEELGEQFDVVLVDAAHTYDAGVSDTALALKVLRPGGVVLFDDFVAHWGGLVRGIAEAAQGRALRRLAGTNLGVVLPD